MQYSRNKNAIRSIVLFSLAFMFCGHAFCYANLSFSGASVMVDASKGNASLVADGQFLATLYWRVRGALSAPLLVGLLSALYLTASAALMADMLRLSHPLSLFALCGTLTLHISVTAINASMLHMADAYSLAFLMAVLSAWLCLQHPLGWIPGAACFAAVPGLAPGMYAAAPALILLVCLLRLPEGEGVRANALLLLRSLAGFAMGFALYCAAALLFCRRQGAALNASFHVAASLTDAWLLPIRQLFAPTTAYARLCVFLSGVLLAMGVLALFVRVSSLGLSARLPSLICALLLPLVLGGMPVFGPAADRPVSQRLVFCLLPIAVVALLERLYASLPPSRAKALRSIAAAAFGVTFLSSIVFSNQVYLKKNLEYQSTLSVMTRVIELAEQTEGFDPTTTPVAIVGTIEDSGLSIPHKGFEHLAVLDAAANNFTASSQEENTWYFWEIMGYPFNFVSDYERDLLASTEAVAAMPAFPQRGCCRMVEGTLVIRLSE